MFALTPREWSKDAACAEIGPVDYAFFPDSGSGGYNMAREVCDRCPVRYECLQDALDRDEQWGMYGGLTPNERKALKTDGAA